MRLQKRFFFNKWFILGKLSQRLLLAHSERASRTEGGGLSPAFTCCPSVERAQGEQACPVGHRARNVPPVAREPCVSQDRSEQGSVHRQMEAYHTVRLGMPDVVCLLTGEGCDSDEGRLMLKVAPRTVSHP